MFRPRIHTRPFRSLLLPRTQQRNNWKQRAQRQSQQRAEPQTQQQTQQRTQRIGGEVPQQYQRFGGGRSRGFALPRLSRGSIALIVGGVVIVIWPNIEEVPVSGRRRFNIISPDLEAYIATGTFEQIKETYRDAFLPDHDRRVQQVKRVLGRLLPYAQGKGLEEVQWEVYVIDDPEQNAFVIPGGKVFVFTGILPLCENEDGIAAVLGHEIAHVVAHHQAETMSIAPFILLGVLFLATLNIPVDTSGLLMDLLLKRPGSRKQEAEADYIGLMMMAQGCYRPEAAMELWRRMERANPTNQPQVLSTHPSNHNREEKIREWLPTANEKRDLSECHELLSYVDQFAAAFNRESW